VHNVSPLNFILKTKSAATEVTARKTQTPIAAKQTLTELGI